MSKDTVDTSMLPRTMRDRDAWGVTKQLDVDFTETAHSPFDINRQSGWPQSTDRHSLDDAISKIESADTDLHLVFWSAPEHVILEWELTKPTVPVEHWEVNQTIKQLDTYTEYIGDGDRAQMIVKAPIESGALKSRPVTMYSGSVARPIWSPTTSHHPMRSSERTVAELSEQEFYDHFEQFLPWTHPTPDATEPDPELWTLTAQDADAPWATPSVEHALSDEKILTMAHRDSASGDTFQALMETTGEDFSDNIEMAQQALMNLLAYWFCFDTPTMKQYFGQSPLATHTRVHADGTTNIERLIARALQFVDDCYRHDGANNGPSRETWDPNRMQIS